MTELVNQTTPLHSEALAIRGYLVFAARHRQLVSAEQVNAGTGVVKSRVAQRVNELNRSEHAEGRPLLGAIVTSGQPPRPTSGFVSFAREILEDADDVQAFWRSQCDSVWAFAWSD
ncbi:MAG: hypothetical protein IT299_12150 [Dehalococcoidia bacterium]|nr:hypothetical protein [Dehalococcoidia bacterium]